MLTRGYGLDPQLAGQVRRANSKDGGGLDLSHGRVLMSTFTFNSLLHPSSSSHQPFIMIGVALSSSARSLRTTRSLGSLRAAVATPSAAVPPLPQARTLVSTVLLTRETYDKRNVAQLKDECKQRGLTTSGRRADIVARLLNDDARQNGSGIREEPAAKTTHRRTNSSLASLRGSDAPSSSSSSSGGKNAPSKKTTASPPSPNDSTLADSPTARSPVDAHTVTSGTGASISTPEDIQPGEVSHAGQPLGQGQPAISSKEKLDASSNPPGVPPQKEPSHHPTTFKVEVPSEPVEEKHGPEIVSRRSADRDVGTLNTHTTPSPSPAAHRHNVHPPRARARRRTPRSQAHDCGLGDVGRGQPRL